MNKNFKLKPLVLAVAAIAAAGYHCGLYAQEQDQSQEPVIEEEEVIVYGIRRALKNAADIKRESDVFLDAISAEDIGKLPDRNAAESLRRVTGVQIGTRAGQGSSVRIRGSANVNIEVDGLIYTGTGTGGEAGSGSNISRNIGLEDIPSDLLKGIQVIKSQSAEMNEGGLTGTVRLLTRQPLDIEGMFVGGNIRSVYSDAADQSNESASIYLSNNWDDTIGVMLNVSQLNTLSRNDTVEFFNWGPIQFLDSDGGTRNYLIVEDDQGRTAVGVTPSNVIVRQREVEQDRLSTNLALQFRPNDDLEFGLKVLHSEFEELQSTATLQFGPRDTDGANASTPNAGIILRQDQDLNFGAFTPGVGSTGNYVTTDADGNSVVRSLTDAGVDGEITIREASFQVSNSSRNGGSHRHAGQVALRDSVNTNLGFNAKWTSDNLDVSYNGSAGRAVFDSIFVSQDVNGSQGNVNGAFGRDPRPLDPVTQEPVPLAENLRFSYDLGSGPVGGLAIDPTLRGANPNVEGENYLTDPYSYALGFTGVFVSEYESRRDSNQLDFKWKLHTDFLSAIKFGVRNVQREDSRTSHQGSGFRFRFECSDRVSGFEDCFDNGGTWTNRQIGANDANSLYIQPANRQDYYGVTDGSFFSGVDGAEGLPRQWITGNPGALGSNPLARLREDLNMTLIANPLFDYSVEQDTTAVYTQAEFDYDDLRLSGNVGLRYVDTEFKVKGIGVANGVESIVLGGDIYRDIDYVDIVDTIEISEVLPSVNLSWDLNDEIKFRFAANRAIAYQDFQDLVPGERITNALSLTGERGNPDLDPWKVNQADIGAEWYFDEENGGNLSAAIFYKDFESFITSESVPIDGSTRGITYRTEQAECDALNLPSTLCQVGQATGIQGINGTGEVKGFELGYNLPLPMGFGTWGNYTYLDSEDSDGLPIPSNSENTYNLVVYWEDFGFDVRFAYFWQDEALLRANGFNGSPEYRKDRGQLDFSAGYDYDDRLSFNLAITNLTEEVEEDYSQIEERLLAVRQFDRQVIFSVRGKF